MKPLYTQIEFNQAKSKDLLSCECYHCAKSFLLSKHRIQQVLNPNCLSLAKFCSKTCQDISKRLKEKVHCKNCEKTFEKIPAEIKRSPNHFCSKSCAAAYNNKNKTTGNRRSKLEIWLEEKLTSLYPDLEIHFNRKDTIGSELDFYFPSLKLAVELNGIFHYEPIYGQDKLNQIQNNDSNKFQKCQELGISLCIIDSSSLLYFKEQNCLKYLKIIQDIIDKR